MPQRRVDAPPRRGRPMTNVELVDSLCGVSAVLREGHRRHLESFGTLIPHIFMSEVLAYVGTSLGGATGTTVVAPAAEVEEILGLLERGMEAGDRETRNVISMSFAGDGELEPFFDKLKPLLGPHVLAQLQGK